MGRRKGWTDRGRKDIKGMDGWMDGGTYQWRDRLQERVEVTKV